jgi:hypothetical protein
VGKAKGLPIVWSPPKGTGLHDAAVLLTTVKSVMKEDSLLEEIQIPFLDEKNCLFLLQKISGQLSTLKKKTFYRRR